LPFGFGTASCAPRIGTQYDPLAPHPCGQDPLIAGFGSPFATVSP